MSSNVLGAVVGGAVGFLVGGPTGALIGAGIGLAGSALVGGLGVGYDGPRLSDLSVQTSTYGADIPRVHSTIVVSGNVLWLENNKLRERVRKVSGGGKGGSDSATKEYTYYATFHLGLCEGPVAGIRRIWCSDKLLYDAGSDDLETIIASNEVARNWTFYKGSDDQLPTARYEADVGVGNATGHRGLCYIEFRDFELTDYGNTLEGAQFRVELAVGGATSTNSVGSTSARYYPATTGTEYPPQPRFLSAERAIIDVPQWHINGNKVKAVTRYEFSLTRLVRELSISVSSVDTSLPPPTGDSDDPNDIWVKTTSVFPTGAQAGSAAFNSTSGYVQKRKGVRVGINNFSGTRTLYALTDGIGDTTVSTTTTAITFAIGPSAIYAISASAVSIYAFDLQLISSHSLALPTIIYPYARAEWVDGEIILYDGVQTSGGQNGIYRIPDDFSSFELIATIPVDTEVAASASDAVFLSPGMVVRASSSRVSESMKVQWFDLNSFEPGVTELSAVLIKEVELSGLLSASDIDVSAMTQGVKGYRVTGGSIRSALEPLSVAYQFDIVPSGYKLKAVPRGQVSVLTVPYADLGATASDTPSDVFKLSREMDSQLPAKNVVKYLDAERDYDIGEQAATRINTEAVNEVESELALVLGADEAAGIAEVLQARAWLQRTDVSFTLPPTYLALEPCDVITVQTPDADYEVLASELEYTQDGRIEVKGKPNAAAIYTPNASGGEGNIPPGTIGLAGPSLFVPLDIPVVDETVQNAPGFVGTLTGYTGGWPGGVVYRSPDNGQTWVDLQAWSAKCTIGSTPGALAEHDGYLIDQSQLNVIMISGALESITRDQLLAGYNYAAYGVDGRWEIVRFQNADLQADGSYTVYDFVRGDKGTEWATGLHQPGDWFVLLGDPDNAFIGMAAELIGIDRLYRGITQRASIDTGEDVPFTYRGVNLEPLSPVYARASRDGGGNLAATFVRRSRLSSSWWGTGVVAPVGEASQAFEVDVLEGATVVRTIETATEAFSYSAADQTTDFGSTQSSITFRIYQLSETVGRGYAYEVTL